MTSTTTTDYDTMPLLPKELWFVVFTNLEDRQDSLHCLAMSCRALKKVIQTDVSTYIMNRGFLNITDDAACSGSLGVVEYLIENRFFWDQDICDNVARDGHLEVLKRLIENGCPWETSRPSTDYPDPKISKYLRENNLSCDGHACTSAGIDNSRL